MTGYTDERDNGDYDKFHQRREYIPPPKPQEDNED